VRRGISNSFHSSSNRTQRAGPIIYLFQPGNNNLRANKFQVLIIGIIIFRTHKLRRPPQSYSQHTSNMFVFLVIYCFLCVWILKVWLKKKQTREREDYFVCAVSRACGVRRE
jgi:hypothetical protein